jgi:hypothetical protein
MGDEQEWDQLCELLNATSGLLRQVLTNLDRVQRMLPDSKDSDRHEQHSVGPRPTARVNSMPFPCGWMPSGRSLIDGRGKSADTVREGV